MNSRRDLQCVVGRVSSGDGFRTFVAGDQARIFHSARISTGDAVSFVNSKISKIYVGLSRARRVYAATKQLESLLQRACSFSVCIGRSAS